MRRLSILGVLVLVVSGVVPVLATSDPGEYRGPYFGRNNFPPACTRDNAAENPHNTCYRMATGLNGLDSPQIDVLLMVPVSPTAERDMRIMRQSMEMWEGGLHSLAGRMGLDWLADGVDFHVTVDYVDPQDPEIATGPIVDPEIVVIATNPVGGAGIGIDPVDFAYRVGLTDDGDAPCHPVANPLDFAAWQALPGFDAHHGSRSGTYYAEDCGGENGEEGGGGNICFAINGAVDPEPSTIDLFNLFDLVSHEFGHCLTLGHVGDGGEQILGNGWGAVPTNDIMSYNSDPEGLNKCVSTLDVETFAIRMSRYLDVNGDGFVDEADRLEPNDRVGTPDGLNPLQVQRPQDHRYASATGLPTDCPQPDLGLLPGPRTDWEPDPQPTVVESLLTVAAPVDGAAVESGVLAVAGSVEYRVDGRDASAPPAPLAPPPPYDGTLTVQHRGAFEVEQSTFGATDQVPAIDSSHHYTLDLTRADVRFELAWQDIFPLPPRSDLDLFVTGENGASSGDAGATAANPERVELSDVTGALDIRVRPRFVNTFTNYTLTIVVTPLDGDFGGLPAPDEDRDGVRNEIDACPWYPGTGADGCTALTPTEVLVYVDGEAAGAADVHADYWRDGFSIPVTVAAGVHQIRIDWVDGDTVLASRTLTVTAGDAFA